MVEKIKNIYPIPILFILVIIVNFYLCVLCG
jgi:hypothetical protein